MKHAPLLAGLVAAAAIPLGTAAQDQPAPPSPPQAAPNAESRASSPGEPAKPGGTLRTEKRPWLGVATSPVDPAVREHLGLPEGFGVSVDYVMEGSPAASAGLRAHDILVRLDDQRLTTPEHLSLLVRSLAKGDRVKLTVVRKGAEQTVEVVLGENDVPVQPEWPRHFGLQVQPVPGNPHQWQFQGQFPLPLPPGGANAEEWQKALRDYQDRLKEWIEKNHPRHFSPPPRPAPAPDPKAPRDGAPKDPAAGPAPSKKSPPLPLPGQPPRPEGGAGPSGEKTPALSVRPGFPIQVFSGSGLIRIDNQAGEVTIQLRDGKHSISIVNADGETVYQGDYDPAKGAEALPEEARQQLKKMKLDDLKVLGLPPAGPSEGAGAEIKIEIEAAEPAPRSPAGPAAGPL